MLVRFLHTADWHLGMPARFLAEEAASRFAAARLDAVRAVGRLARERACAFILVCGDVFDSNLVGRRTVNQATTALAEAPVPVYLLPGNHDPADPLSVYGRDEFRRSLPERVRVLDAPGLVEALPGVELVAAPWPSKRPTEDLAAAACRPLAPRPAGVVRILAAHGAVDALAPQDALEPSLIRLQGLEGVLGDGLVDFVALGDRHSATSLGRTGRVWYPGAPEVTAFTEEGAGRALVVELDAGGCRVDAVEVGRWRFLRRRQDVSGADGVDALAEWFSELPDKTETALRLELAGTVSMAEHARLTLVLERFGDVLAGLDLVDEGRQVAVLPSQEDFADLRLGGFAAAAIRELRQQAAGEGEAARVAREALQLAFRLSREGAP